MKAFYGNFDNLRPHQLKIIGDLAQPTEANYTDKYKIGEDTEQNFPMKKTPRNGRSLVLLRKFRKLIKNIQEKIQGLRIIG